MTTIAKAITQAIIRCVIHAVIYAQAGGYKSTMAATFPKKMIVFGFDTLSKLTPYTRRGIAMPEYIGDFGQGVIEVRSKKDPERTIIQIELYHDDEVNDDGSLEPTAFLRFLARMPSFYQEVREGEWKTAVIDTLTSMTLASKNMHQFKLQKHETEANNKWNIYATADIEQVICCRLVGVLRAINFLVLCHIDKDKTEVAGTKLGIPSAPGRLGTADGLAARFAEMWCIRPQRHGQTVTRHLQTQPDATHNAMSAINAPDGCEPRYQALWANWDADVAEAQAAREKVLNI
jgi:hypothetical protein